MIKAKHQKWADWIFKLYIYRLMKNNFAKISLLGDIPKINTDLPTLLIPNHNTWWDGFFIYLLNRKIFKQNAHVMMLESQLQHFNFFKRVGAYSIDPDNPKKTLESLHYTSSLLEAKTNPKSLICLFPQGELNPWTSEKIEFKPGLDWIIRKFKKPLNLIMLAIRCEFLKKKHAEVFLLFSENFETDFNNFQGISWAKGIELKLLKNLTQKIMNREEGKLLLKGKSKR
jgi:1-acyl-sn-glycerol-3-phosphate acyltransferase